MILTGNDINVKNIINKNYNIKINAGCTIEYNINSMINNPIVTGPADTNSTLPFKKLFPIDTIIKPNRPEGAGIKYYVIGDVNTDSYTNPKLTTYNKPSRLYIPGADLVYKYYISPVGTGSREDTLSVSYSKKIFVNKIVAKFEISHSIPTSFSISATTYGGSETVLKSGTSSNIKAFGSETYDAGTVAIYYTGSGWSFSELDLNHNAHVELSAVKLKFVAASGEYVGVIELAPKYVIDVSNDLIDFNINKESSFSEDSSLPVGSVNANTLTLNLNTYNESSLRAKSYDKTYSEFQSDIVYFYKMSEVKPYIKIFNSNGLYGTTEKYDKIPQGTFYMDSSNISDMGDITINALDGAKILQEIIPQDALCKKYSVVSILRRMLDNVGFTNYKFNLNGENETSIMTPLYWWTDDQKTVWEHIQELCRDSQMTAVFDENNVLQFYSRDYLYNKYLSDGVNEKQTDWVMQYQANGDLLPNIINFSKNDLASKNKIKIEWQTPQLPTGDQTATPIWQSSESYLAAFGLSATLSATATTGDYISLIASTTADYQKNIAINSFNGYLLLDAEIIEYDAIQYRYVPEGGGLPVEVDITSESDILKYNALSDQNPANFQPTGKYRIKTRGAFGTTNAIKEHKAISDSIINSWTMGGAEFNISLSSINALTNSKVINRTSTTGTITAKTLFVLTNKSTVPNHYEIAYKDFPSVTAQSGVTKYYAFGTTMSLDIEDSDSLDASGGLAFFVSDSGTTMYYVQIRSTYGTNQLEKSKDVVIYKVIDGKIKEITDSQNRSLGTEITNIYGGVPFKLDILLESTATYNKIILYLNGNRITAIDNASGSNVLVPFSSKIGMISRKGNMSFDYIYGTDMTKESYNKNTVFNPYTGQYSDTTLKILFGNKIIDTSGLGVISNAVEDFGPVAREIKKDLIRFNTRPAYPLEPSLGINEFIKVLGYTMSSFGAEIYLINNSGTYVPISDGDAASFFVPGKSLSKSSPLEYTNYASNDYTTQELVIFASNWIQTEPDVKNLADWIQKQWAKKQSVIQLDIFGNPMISVGDVVEIDYDYQELPAGQKYLVTAVQQKYMEGLETGIVCRSL